MGRFRQTLATQFDYAKAAEKLGSLDDCFDYHRILATRRNTRHVLIVFLGFFLGGGELFPIYLANQLVRKGFIVSVMALESQGWDYRIRNRLDPSIAVYSAWTAREAGVAKFTREIGADLVHSHFVGSEGLFFCEEPEVPDIPYVTTLHGSYEAIYQPRDFIIQAARHVTHWVYLSKKILIT